MSEWEDEAETIGKNASEPDSEDPRYEGSSRPEQYHDDEDGPDEDGQGMDGGGGGRGGSDPEQSEDEKDEVGRKLKNMPWSIKRNDKSDLAIAPGAEANRDIRTAVLYKYFHSPMAKLLRPEQGMSVQNLHMMRMQSIRTLMHEYDKKEKYKKLYDPRPISVPFVPPAMGSDVSVLHPKDRWIPKLLAAYKRDLARNTSPWPIGKQEQFLELARDRLYTHFTHQKLEEFAASRGPLPRRAYPKKPPHVVAFYEAKDIASGKTKGATKKQKAAAVALVAAEKLKANLKRDKKIAKREAKAKAAAGQTPAAAAPNASAQKASKPAAQTAKPAKAAAALKVAPKPVQPAASTH